MIFSCFTEKVNCAALHLAAQNGHFEVCKIIVEQIEDKDPVDINGDTLLHFAAKNGRLKIYRYLIKNGADSGRVNNSHQIPFDLMFNYKKQMMVTLCLYVITSIVFLILFLVTGHRILWQMLIIYGSFSFIFFIFVSLFLS